MNLNEMYSLPSSTGKFDFYWTSIGQLIVVWTCLDYPTDISGKMDVPRISEGLSVLLGLF